MEEFLKVNWVVFLCGMLVYGNTSEWRKWRLSIGDTLFYYSRPTAILLLFMVIEHVQSVAVHILPYGYTKPWKI